MKQGIHPDWHQCTVTCSCGNTFVTSSLTDSLQIDICNKCHPFFTGEVKFVDRQGRVDRFLTKMQQAEERKTRLAKKASKSTKPETQEEPKSYQELLREQQAQLRKQAKAQ